MNVEEMKKSLKAIGSLVPAHLVENVKALEEFVESINDSDTLFRLLETEAWPHAVYPQAICDRTSETSKAERADGILSFILQTGLDGKKFLDYGTGEGHVAAGAVNHNATLSVGYDIERPVQSTFQWDIAKDNLLLTTDMEKVKQNAPYDVILFYDVLDHVEPDTQTNILLAAKELLADDGYIQIRFHPWCSRHGDHQYLQINKAFVHLIFTQDELASKGLTSLEPCKTKVIHPLATYGKWIRDAGLTVQSKRPQTLQNAVEPFFTSDPVIKNRIRRHWTKSNDAKAREWPSYQMATTFVDYLLTK